MRYALTIQEEGANFQGVNTFIIEDGRFPEEGGQTWLDGGEGLREVLERLIGEKDAETVVANRLYFIRNCDDIDLDLEDPND